LVSQKSAAERKAGTIAEKPSSNTAALMDASISFPFPTSPSLRFTVPRAEASSTLVSFRMRLFTAIDISDEVRANLRAFIARLKPLAKLSWSPVENLHVTTKFIGDWPEKRLDELKSALEGVPRAGPIEVSIREIGWFPDARRPRVFWAGVEAAEPLRELAGATESATAALGVPKEDRAYSPHLTLARIRTPVRLEALHNALSKSASRDAPDSNGFEFGSFRATAFFLYLSLGGRYTKLAAFPLEAET
jgi:RNA 2',3'-cyclic 3'-phosphodiesterase